MSLIETLMKSLDSSALKQISQQLGTDENTARDATGAAVGALVGGLAKNTNSDDGAQSLLSALSRDHDGGIMDNLGSLLGGGDQANGAGILRHVLGSKQTGVESAISQSTGIDKGAAGKLMTMIAPMVLGALGKQSRQSGMDAGQLSQLLQQEKGDLARRQPDGMGMLQGILDADGDGQIEASDLLKHGSKLLGGLFKG